MPAWYIVWLGTVQKAKLRPAHLKPPLLMRHFCILQWTWSRCPRRLFLWFGHRPPKMGCTSAFPGSSALPELLAAIFWHTLQQPSAYWSQQAGTYRRVAETCNIFLLDAAKHEHLDFALSKGVRSSQCTDLSLLATFTYTSYNFLLYWQKAHLQQTFLHSCSPVTFSMR